MGFVRFVVGACAFAAITAQAQKEMHAPLEVVSLEQSHFAHGTWEFENLGGAFFLFDRGGNSRPTLDDLVNSARVGVMLYNPCGPGILRGNLEFLGEGFAGWIFNGPGDVVAGGTLFFRYNFIPRNSRIILYLQGGGGFIYTDYAQGEAGGNALSLPVNFNLQAIAGLRFLINAKWSINAEVSYRHVSNASTSDPNYGIDQAGGALGVGFTF